MLLFIFEIRGGKRIFTPNTYQSVTDTSESTSTTAKSCLGIGNPVVHGAIPGNAACNRFNMHSGTYRGKTKMSGVRDK